MDDGYWGQREKRLLNIGKCYFTLGQFYGRIVIKLCLSVDVAESEDEEFGVVYTMKFGSESLNFGVY